VRTVSELIEHLPADGHARSGSTMVVHVKEETLRTRVGAATLATGGRITADHHEHPPARSGSAADGPAADETATIATPGHPEPRD
jgi:hypothetical protein